MGQLQDISGISLSITCTKDAMSLTQINPDSVDHVIMGNVIGSGLGQNPARQICLGSGINPSASCVNVNKLCASGLKSVILGTQALTLKDGDVALVGGFESMSNMPFLLKNYRKGHKFGHLKIVDSLTYDGLEDPKLKKVAGYFAEHTAREMGITREQQDQYCIRSYSLALEAQKRGTFARQITPVFTKKGLITLDEEHSRFRKDKIPTLKPVFVDKYFTMF
jgi:acetyl-CoA C-acetyltransferase